MLGPVKPEGKVVAHELRSFTRCRSVKSKKGFPHIGEKYQSFFFLNGVSRIKIYFAKRSNRQFSKKSLVYGQPLGCFSVILKNSV